jgi:hypothetical protein
MGDIIVQKSGQSSEELRRNAQQKLGSGDVSVTEQQGGNRVVHLSGEQTQALQKMQPTERDATFGGKVRQQLNG